VGPFLRAVGGQFIQPVDDLAVTGAPFDQTGKPIIPSAVTLGARHPQAIELAEQIAEYDCAVAGHGPYLPMLPRALRCMSHRIGEPIVGPNFGPKLENTSRYVAPLDAM
jgi:hypothetical protein